MYNQNLKVIQNYLKVSTALQNAMGSQFAKALLAMVRGAEKGACHQVLACGVLETIKDMADWVHEIIPLCYLRKGTHKFLKTKISHFSLPKGSKFPCYQSIFVKGAEIIGFQIKLHEVQYQLFVLCDCVDGILNGEIIKLPKGQIVLIHHH